MASSDDDLINKLKSCRVESIDIGINDMNCSLDSITYLHDSWLSHFTLDDDQNRLKTPLIIGKQLGKKSHFILY